MKTVNINSIRNLDPENIWGMKYKGKTLDGNSNTSLNGSPYGYVRKITYNYTLVLQYLLPTQLKDIENELLKSNINQNLIGLGKITGWLNHKKITGDPSFNFDYFKMNITHNADNTFDVTLPLFEIDYNPSQRLNNE